jgi:hypothetical protein
MSSDLEILQPLSRKRKTAPSQLEKRVVDEKDADSAASRSNLEAVVDEGVSDDGSERKPDISKQRVKKRRPNKEAIHIASWIAQNLAPMRTAEEDTSAHKIGVVLDDDGLPVEDEENPGFDRGFPIADVEKMCSLYSVGGGDGTFSAQVKKPALLTLMTFLGKNRITAHKIGVYEDVKIHTFDGVKKLQSIHRWKGDNKVSADVYEQLQAKFGIQWFKIPQWDVQKAKNAFAKIENLPEGKYGYVEILLKEVKMKTLPPSERYPQTTIFATPKYLYLPRVVTLKKKIEDDEDDDDVMVFSKIVEV